MSKKKTIRRKSLKQLKKNFYQIEFRTPGWRNGRFSMSSGVTDRKTADEYKSKLMKVYQAGEFNLLEAVKDRKVGLPLFSSWFDNMGIGGAAQYYARLQAAQVAKSPPLRPLLTEFLTDPDRSMAAKTAGDYEKQILGFIEWLEGELKGSPAQVDHLETTRISTWVRWLGANASHRYKDREELSPKTVRHHRASLSAFATWLVEKNYLKANPVLRSFRPKLVQKDPVYMTREQWALFRAESEAYDAEREFPRPLPETTFWTFLVASGATTYNEGCAVRSLDIKHRDDPNSPMVRVWLGGTKTANRQRSVWIPRVVADAVLAYAERWGRAPQNPIFQFERWEGHYAFGKVCERLVRKGYLEFEQFSPYALRHTYAVAMITGDPEHGVPGCDIVTLARLMGHGDNIQTTMIYARHVGNHAALGSQNMAAAMGLNR